MKEKNTIVESKLSYFFSCIFIKKLYNITYHGGSIMVSKELINLVPILKETIKEIEKTLDLYGYDFDEIVDLIYNFLMTNDYNVIDEFFLGNDKFDSSKLEIYKGIFILTLCTDFYIDIDYRLKNNKICVDAQEEVFNELKNHHTYKQIIFFFRDAYNEELIKIIIEHFLFYIYKDNIYINKCLSNVSKSHNYFKIKAINPLFELDESNPNDRYMIESEFIRSEVFDVYDDLNMKEIEDNLKEEDDNVPYLILLNQEEEKNNSAFIDLSIYEELDPLLIDLKNKIIGLFSKKYPDKDRFNEAIAYIISNAYESIKLKETQDKDYVRIIKYLENSDFNINQMVDVFINDNGFSNYILCEFIRNNKKIKETELIERRKLIENLGFTKVLRKYNHFYDMESFKYGGSKIGKTF